MNRMQDRVAFLVGGGAGIRAGSIFVKYDTNNNGTLSFKFYTLTSAGATNVSGSTAAGTFNPGDTFTMLVSEPGSDMPGTFNINVTGTTAAEFVTNILAANIEHVTAHVSTTGVISLGHSAGGFITLINTSIGHNPITTAGFTSSTTGLVVESVGPYAGSLLASNWAPLTYTYSTTEPYVAPDDGTLWYFGSAVEADVM